MNRELKILLVEDNAGDAFLINEALSTANLNYQLKRAEDGGQALRALEEIERQQSTINLIVLDLNLPKYRGMNYWRRSETASISGRRRSLL